MPSRRVHDILRYFLETSEVHFDEPRVTHVSDRTGYHHAYMGQFPQSPRLRRTIRHSELVDLPVEVYRELLELLTRMSQTNEHVDIGRRFQGVYVSCLESLLCPVSFEQDIRVEFVVSNLNMVETETMSDRVMNHNFGQTIGGIHPDVFAPYKSRKKDTVVKKVEKYFEDDLFRL